jgi:hypothetical protein
MIVTSMQLTISSRRDIAVLQKESSSLEGEEDVNPGREFTVGVLDGIALPVGAPSQMGDGVERLRTLK